MSKKTKPYTLEDLRKHLAKNDPEFERHLAEETQRLYIAEEIYKARMKAGLTQAELAALVGTTTSVISRLEDTDYEGHSMSMLKRIASALGKEIEFRFV